MNPHQCAASSDPSRYELLRQQTLDGQVNWNRQGLAVLRWQGMAAWMQAWSRVAPAGRCDPQSPAPVAMTLPDGASTAVVQVLAAMTLGHMRQVRV